MKLHDVVVAKPSRELAVITSEARLPRTEVVRKVWDHIKKNKLQNPSNKEIVADFKLRAVFGKDRVTMFENEQASVATPELKSAGAAHDILPFLS
jgi:chromatin remodeling complex protein RSC6